MYFYDDFVANKTTTTTIHCHHVVQQDFEKCKIAHWDSLPHTAFFCSFESTLLPHPDESCRWHRHHIANNIDQCSRGATAAAAS